MVLHMVGIIEVIIINNNVHIRIPLGISNSNSDQQCSNLNLFFTWTPKYMDWFFFLFFSRLLLLLLSLFFASELHFFLLQPNQCITTHLFRKKNTQTKLQSFCWFLTFISLSACDKKHTHTHIRILIENTLTKQKSILVYRSFFFHPSCCLWKFKWTKKLIKQEQKTTRRFHCTIASSVYQ